MAGARLGSRQKLGTQLRSPMCMVEIYLSHCQLPPRLHFCRKLELGKELELEFTRT